MRNIFSIIALLCLAAPSWAQPLNRATYASMIQTAEEQVQKQDYYNAIEWYEKSYDERKDYDVALQLGYLNFYIRDYRDASRWFARAIRRDKKGEYNEARFYYAQALKMNEEYDEAIEEFKTYLESATDEAKRELAEAEISGAEFAKIARDADGLTISNAGRKINSSNSEYSPVLAPGGDAMYYASMKFDELVVIEGKGDEDFHVKIYTSQKTDEGWGEPSVLDQQINRPGYHNANIALSKDGRRMYFNRQLLVGNEVSESKIYVSEGSGSSWGPADEVQGINGDYIAKHPAVGELFGKEVLFFVSDMDGGYGGFDLYYATYKGDGIFGDPVNLGPKLNTAGDEVTPFYRDGVLYFSSDGHPGLGGLDIFNSVWDGTIWSEPANMGKGYNSSVDDQYFMLDEEGYTGFLTSNRPGNGSKSVKGRTCCDDIYNVSLKVITADLVATVFDSETKKQLSGATVELIDLTDDTPASIGSKSNSSGNAFDWPLELDQMYRLIATRDDYFADTVEFHTEGLLDSKTFQLELFLDPAPVYITLSREEPIELENIYYDFDDDKILSDAEQDLQLVLELMAQYPDMVIELSSHTDARGNDAYNRALSQRRAESARRWLIERGVERKRIQAVGYGETQPKKISAKLGAEYDFLKEGDELTEAFINTLETEEQKEAAHQINRRTEFKIVAGPTSIKIEERRLVRKGATEVKPEQQQQEQDEKKN
ncbi:MAG: OmpA family protein [Saprospiraceae bacterium]|nr:OmpA family protein [Saprospiraceae bacterium]MCB0623047.1 OmpA family protein [Saprospiraceae bacterium]MCB0679324.1 OmpA family protein [Saprospiraceae bacterium]